MNNITELTKSLPQNVFFGTQDLAFNIAHYNIEVDTLSCYLFGYEGKMSLSIYADKEGLLLVKQLLAVLQQIKALPFSNQLIAKNSQTKLYLQDKTDYQIVKYCAEKILSQLQQKESKNLLPKKIESQVEYIENPFN